MKVTKENLLFLIVLIVGILLFAFRVEIADMLERKHTFVITDLEMEDMLGYKTKIQDGFNGYVIFYTDMESCSSCLAQIGDLADVSKQFDEAGYYAVLKERNNRQNFARLMTEQNFPGEALLDSNLLIESRLGLSEHPMLIFFNREKQMIATMPLDVTHDQLKRQLIRYLEEI